MSPQSAQPTSRAPASAHWRGEGHPTRADTRFSAQVCPSACTLLSLARVRGPSPLHCTHRPTLGKRTVPAGGTSCRCHKEACTRAAAGTSHVRDSYSNTDTCVSSKQAMDKHNIYIKELLDLTLEIIHLLTGEDYTVVKKTSGDGQYPINMDPSHFLTSEINTNKKILEVTNRILKLLTEEGWKYLEDSKDLYKDGNSKIQQIIPTLDGSSNGNPPERYPYPLYSRNSSQEDPTIPHHHQVQELADVKVEGKEEAEEMCVIGGPHSTDKVKVRVTIKEEGILPEISTDEHLDCDLEANVISQDCQGEKPVTQNSHHSEESSSDLSNAEESSSDQADSVPPATLPGPHIMDGPPEPANLEETSANSSYSVSPVVCPIARSPNASKPEESPSNSLEMASPGLHNIARSLDLSISEDQPVCKSENVEPCPSTEKGECLVRASNIAEDPKTDTDIISFICSDCGESFKEQEELDHHRRTHTGKKPYSCSDCGKRFPVKSKLIQHLRVHTGEKPFPCAVCGRCFTTKTNLATHQSIHTEEKPFPCSKCGKCFSRKSSLLTHLRIHNGDKDFTCGECGKSFTLKCYLRIHEKIHTGEKPFACSECGKCFLQRSAFVKHQRLHRGDKPFSCPECGRCFLEKGQLAIHQRIHTGERPYACSECYKSFIKKSDLQRHQRTHTGEKPFSCNECGKCFTQKAHLVAHRRVHTGEKPSSCSECGRCPRKSLSGQHHEGHTH